MRHSLQYSLVLSTVCLLLFLGCRIKIEVPAGGSVYTESGTYQCRAGEVCQINVYDAYFDETFVAIPEPGYRFAGWQRRDGGLCGGSDVPCALPVASFIEHDFLTVMLESDTEFYLTPVFVDEQATREEIYKTAGDISLRLWIMSPPGHKDTDSRAAVVFFHGGGWLSGSHTQFERQARLLTSLGMVSVLVEYRVLGRNGTLVEVAIEDAKSAIRWVRSSARRLGIDPLRIGAAGGSAGGHLAAAAALVPGFNALDDPEGVSSVPNALVLFNPALIIAPLPGVFQPPESLSSRVGVEFAEICPFYHLKATPPPTLIMHGTEDLIVPFISVRVYCIRAQFLGGDCTLIPYEGAHHTFFNQDPYYETTAANMVDFLDQLGWLSSI